MANKPVPLIEVKKGNNGLTCFDVSGAYEHKDILWGRGYRYLFQNKQFPVWYKLTYGDEEAETERAWLEEQGWEWKA